MAKVERDSVASQQAPHQLRQLTLSGAEQEVEVV